MHPRRRLLTRGPFLFDLTPERLVTFHGERGVRRETGGDVPTHAEAPVSLAALEDASRVWVGCGNQKAFALEAGASGTAQALAESFFDLTTEGSRLVGARVDSKRKLTELRVSDDASGTRWRAVKPPKPVRAKPVPGYTLEGRGRESPDGVLLDTSPLGLTVLEKGRGRVYVLRPGAEALEGGLQLQPGADEDTWRAQATPQGVLVLLIANHRHTALAHFALDGTLLGVLSELDGKPLWGGLGMCVLDATRALLLCDEPLLVSLPGLEILERVEGEWRNYVATAPAGPGRCWVGAEDSDALTLLTFAPGEPPRVSVSERPVDPGPALVHLGFTRPALDCHAETPSPLSVSAPVAETWRLTLRNQGSECHGVRLRLSSPLIGAGVVKVEARGPGGVLALSSQNRVELVGQLPGLASGAAVELSFSLTPRGEGEGDLTLTAEPLVSHRSLAPFTGEVLESPPQVDGRGASARLRLQVE